VGKRSRRYKLSFEKMKAGTKNISWGMVNHVEAKYARSISAPQ
jgi:hypothetical protein